jgi:hypothetical protein
MDCWIRKIFTRPILGDDDDYLLPLSGILELPTNTSAAAQNKKNEESPVLHLSYSSFSIIVT